MKKLAATLTISLCLLSVACSKVPSDVIKPHAMARLLADVHTGESIVELERTRYYTDSMKQVMKQSVLRRHGVTSEQFDSSLAWYGRNIKEYMEVYDETIEILEHRLIETGNRVAAENALSIAGDSVDVWPNPRYITINDRTPSKILTFNFARDPNWERGDNYTWRVKLFNAPQDSRWTIGAQYADGTMEYVSSTAGGDGWKEIKFQTDSMLDPVRIFGYFDGNNRPGSDLRLDSIEMVRKRVSPNLYQRPYANTKRHFYPAVELETLTDSVAH